MAHFIHCTSCGEQYNEDAFEECPFCGFSPNGNNVICPNFFCGKEVGDKLDYCPFCHTQLIKPKKTAADIINEHKQKKDNLREKIRKKYNIEGDISEEEYTQLLTIYKEEKRSNPSSYQPPKTPQKAADIINEHKQKKDNLRETIRKNYNIEGDISEEEYTQLLTIYKEEKRNNPSSYQPPKTPKKKRKISKGVGIVIVLLALLGGFFIWKTHYEKEEKARIERMDQERIEQERRIEQKRKEQEQREQEQMEQERLEQERKKQERIEQERIEHERRLNSAPYGYDQWGVPYASLDQKNLAEALDEYDKARLGYIKATTTGDYWDLMYYHQCMKRQIENCLFYAKSLGDEKLIYELKKMERDVDNLGF